MQILGPANTSGLFNGTSSGFGEVRQSSVPMNYKNEKALGIGVYCDLAALGGLFLRLPKVAPLSGGMD